MATADVEFKDLKLAGLKDLKRLEDLKVLDLKDLRDLKVLAWPEKGFSAVVPDREGGWWVWRGGRKADEEGENKMNKKKKQEGWWNSGRVGGIDLGLWIGWI